MSSKVDDPLDNLEREIYELLCQTFHREECAAKAVARLEYDIVRQYQAAQAPPSSAAEDVDPEETQEAEFASSRDFSSDEFQSLFTNLNVLRMVDELAKLLGVTHLAPEILSTIIADSFKSRPSGSAVGRSANAEETFIGNDMEMTFRTLRERAARQQRSNKRAGR
jgi:hypothetical protein